MLRTASLGGKVREVLSSGLSSLGGGFREVLSSGLPSLGGFLGRF